MSSCGIQQQGEVCHSLCSQKLVCWVFSYPVHSWACWSHFPAWVSASCDGKWYGSWKLPYHLCFGEKQQLASNPTRSYVEIYTFYLGMYQGKQTLGPGRKTTFVPKLLHVQSGNLCIGPGCVGGDSNYFTCLTLSTAANLSETQCEFWCLRKELPQSLENSCLELSAAG